MGHSQLFGKGWGLGVLKLEGGLLLMYLYLYLYAIVLHLSLTCPGHGLVSGMSKTTKRIMAGAKNRLNTFENWSLRACGHDEGVMKALRARDRLLVFLEDEIEKLAKKAGEA